MIFTRKLILNDINSKNSLTKGVLTLTQNQEELHGELRLYGVEQSDNQICAIGINVGNEILKIPTKIKNNICSFKTKTTLDLAGKVSCALVDITKLADPKIIVGGSSAYIQEWATKVEQAFCLDFEPISKEEMYELDDNQIDSVVTKTIQDDQEYHDCSNCKQCKYREAFFSNNLAKDQDVMRSSQENIVPEQQVEPLENSPIVVQQDLPSDNNILQEGQFINLKADETEQDDDKSFYEQVKGQIDALFEQYSSENALEELLPNSKWVRVRYENSENFYVLGLIYNDDQIQYISYGLPADNPNKPPQDLKEYAQWLPLDQSNPQGQGYWLVYQSAESGDSIEVEVI